jgi:putative ABC transport system substrate-binding protein
MNKSVFHLALSALLLALCLPASAQQPKKLTRIGYLSARDRASDTARAEPFRIALREFGYVEGQNIAIEYRYADGRRERFPEIAVELARLKVDIIVVAGGDALLQSVMNATKTIPIVMSGGGADPVDAGMVQSLARPGGNVTGITLLVIELAGKRLELLKDAVPKLTRVAALYESANPTSVREVKEILPTAAPALGLTIRPWEIRAAEEFERVFTAMGKERSDGLYVSTSALTNSNQKRIVGFALKTRLPSVYGRQEYVINGGLLYYGADFADSYRRVAYYVDKILNGAKPADLPVEQPTKFEMVINLKTAKQIGVTIPPDVLARATRIIR